MKEQKSAENKSGLSPYLSSITCTCPSWRRAYSLQTIKTRESDHHHIVIGIKQE